MILMDTTNIKEALREKNYTKKLKLVLYESNMQLVKKTYHLQTVLAAHTVKKPLLLLG